MIELNMVDENTVEINGAMRITDTTSGLKVKLLTTPAQKWVGPQGAVRSGSGFEVPKTRIATTPVKAVADNTYENLFTYSDNTTLDPHRYLNGHNDMRIDESVTRATERVYHTTWAERYTTEKGSKRDLAIVVLHLIRRGVGRDGVYRLGGRAKNLKATGSFDRYTLVELLQWAAIIDGDLREPVLSGR